MTATQYVKASYQEIIDLKTTTNTVSVVGIHTPTSYQPYQFLRGFFEQFKKYRYNGCSMALVPAARMPADISQVGYEGGSPPIDARDILNPILFHGCHGEALGPILDGFINGPGTDNSFGSAGSTPSIDHRVLGSGQGAAFDTLYEKLYYRALTDNTWLKAHPQTGFRKKGMHPLVYDVSTNHAIPGGMNMMTSLSPTVKSGLSGVPRASGALGLDVYEQGSGGSSQGRRELMETPLLGDFDIVDTTSSTPGQMYQDRINEGISYFTSRLHRLGWLDTTTRHAGNKVVQQYSGLAPTSTDISNFLSYISENLNSLPLLYMGVILLPPAYKANQYMRLVLNHSFSFKGFRGISTNMSNQAWNALASGPNTDGGYNDLINTSVSTAKLSSGNEGQLDYEEVNLNDGE